MLIQLCASPPVARRPARDSPLVTRRRVRGERAIRLLLLLLLRDKPSRVEPGSDKTKSSPGQLNPPAECTNQKVYFNNGAAPLLSSKRANEPL